MRLIDEQMVDSGALELHPGIGGGVEEFLDLLGEGGTCISMSLTVNLSSPLRLGQMGGEPVHLPVEERATNRRR